MDAIRATNKTSGDSCLFAGTNINASGNERYTRTQSPYQQETLNRSSKIARQDLIGTNSFSNYGRNRPPPELQSSSSPDLIDSLGTPSRRNRTSSVYSLLLRQHEEMMRSNHSGNVGDSSDESHHKLKDVVHHDNKIECKKFETQDCTRLRSCVPFQRKSTRGGDVLHSSSLYPKIRTEFMESITAYDRLIEGKRLPKNSQSATLDNHPFADFSQIDSNSSCHILTRDKSDRSQQRHEEEQLINLTYRATASIDNEAMKSIPSAFYRSALEEAVSASLDFDSTRSREGVKNMDNEREQSYLSLSFGNADSDESSVTRSILPQANIGLSHELVRNDGIFISERIGHKLSNNGNDLTKDMGESSLISRADSQEDDYLIAKTRRHLGSHGDHDGADDFLSSQRKALEEYERENIRRKSGKEFTTHCHITHPTSASSGYRERRRSCLEAQGASETRQAIHDGTAQMTKCKGCNERLQAPACYSLVFCPKCKTISPA